MGDKVLLLEQNPSQWVRARFDQLLGVAAAKTPRWTTWLEEQGNQRVLQSFFRQRGETQIMVEETQFALKFLPHPHPQVLRSWKAEAVFEPSKVQGSSRSSKTSLGSLFVTLIQGRLTSSWD